MKKIFISIAMLRQDYFTLKKAFLFFEKLFSRIPIYDVKQTNFNVLASDLAIMTY